MKKPIWGELMDNSILAGTPKPAPVITAEMRRRLGVAWALWSLMVIRAEWVSERFGWIANARPISDAQLSEELEASRATIARWRLRLKKASLLGWYVAPGIGRVFWATPPHSMCERKAAVSEKPRETSTGIESVRMASRYLQ